jgi:hypothetical protein
MKGRSGIWGYKAWLALVVVAWAFGALLVLSGCSKAAAPTPVAVASPLPTCVVNVTNNGDGNVNVNGCGNTTVTQPSPSPSPGQAGDNVVNGFAIFCYGFGTPEGKPEPNHNLCALPVGYPSIAVTASPKNKAGDDIPEPGDKTSEKVIDWTFTVSPANAATLKIQPDNRFNAQVIPATSRVPATFTLTAKYVDPKGGTHDADKAGSIQ